MSWIIVDVECDGPVPGVNSMVCFGAVLLDKDLKKTFYGQTKPISTVYKEDALAISGFTREEHEKFEDPASVMDRFANWIQDNSKGRPVFASDNPAGDFSWINYYFHVYHGSNPFGWSARRIADLFCGFYNDPFFKWKKFRVTKHTHNPVDDAMGNAEALHYLISQGFKLDLK